jgi:hypothetical protein
MRIVLPRSLPLLVSLMLAVACGTTESARKPARATTPTRASVVTTPAARGLYAADEALRDVLSGRWEYVGTGRWLGINRMHACMYRNERVLLVDVYCTITDSPAFRLDVFSPTRGRVRIYAETNGPVSAKSRRDYFTFTAESEPPPGADKHLPPVRLAMSFDELRAYDEQRYNAFLPACYGGKEHQQERQGCLGPLAMRSPEWSAQNRGFLTYANDDWYRVLRELRALAPRYGREPE